MRLAMCDHIGLFTGNAARLKKFYEDILGFNLKHESILPMSTVEKIFGIKCECRFFKLLKNNFMLEIFEPLSIEPKQRVAGIVGINHWGYCADDREALVEELRKRSVPVIEVIRNGHSVYFIIDPDENRIEIRDCRT
jgi:catechol 2,3-dioxygenase-like lactoylglutathione lyase family enzyme